jgi:response regulator RpfG family c-di-GMP phosphodiesterase
LSVLHHHAHAEPTRSRESLGLLLRVLDEHTPGVMEDLNRMGHLAADTARLMGLDAAETERIELAARLHDVGKLAIPDAILEKPGPLDPAEWVVMRTHAEIGARILASAPTLAESAELVHHHHEHYDGGGYPDHLAGGEIPLGSCVIGVCAAFVAMMRHRAFSDAITIEEALAELRRCSGTQFHPLVVTTFCAMVESPGWQLAAQAA